MARLAFLQWGSSRNPAMLRETGSRETETAGVLEKRVQIFRCRPVLCRFEKMVCTPVLFAMLKNVKWHLVSTGTIRGRKGTRWGREGTRRSAGRTYLPFQTN